MAHGVHPEQGARVHREQPEPGAQREPLEHGTHRERFEPGTHREPSGTAETCDDGGVAVHGGRPGPRLWVKLHPR